MKKFIAIFGGAPQSGKTTFANMIAEKMGVKKVHEMGFAVKKKAAKCLNIDYKTADKIKDKGRVKVFNEKGNLISDFAPRLVMQEVMSGIFEPYGIRSVMSAEAYFRIFKNGSDGDKIVSGFRCPANALDMAQLTMGEYEFIRVLIKRDGFSNEDCHYLEKMTDLLKPDFTVEAGNLKELKTEVDRFVNFIK